MNLTDFSTYLMNELDLYLRDFSDHDYRIVDIKKADDVVTKALILQGQNGEVLPYMDIKPYYEKWKNNKSLNLEDVFCDVADRYIRFCTPKEPESDVLGYDYDYSRHSEYIIPQIDNYEANKEWIDKIPHTMIDDMAVTYHIYTNPGSTERRSYPITYDALKNFHITVDEIHSLALSNISNLLYVNVKEMTEVFVDIYKNYVMLEQGFNESTAREYVKNEILPTEFPNLKTGDMYLLSTLNTDYGSAAMLCDEYQKMLSGMTGGDFYILPSSPHEVLVIPDRGQTMKMLTDIMINATDKLLPDNVHCLSNCIMKYDSISQTLSSVFDITELKENTQLRKKDVKVAEEVSSVYKATNHVEAMVENDSILSGGYQRPIGRFR